MTDKTTERWKDIYTTYDESDATLIVGLLESEGIPARVESSKISNIPVSVGKLGEITVYVKLGDFEKAGKVLERARQEEGEEP